ncbi:MAG: aspartate/glutamate racemase family protein [Planctomycetota bacterium]|jgi:aspartate racemase|nr:aspartate/glutamate racemase family protein [Planctomycetota bacterium]
MLGREAVIAIGGGVGPMAGVALHAGIIEATRTDRGDQSHLRVIHHSDSPAIPDRSAYLALPAAERRRRLSPGTAMAGVFAAMARALAAGEPAVGGIPCNTFHVPEIFDEFQAEMAADRNPIRVLDMLEETLGLLRERLAGQTGLNIGVLATGGTRRSGVYDRLLERAGQRISQVDEADQPRLHDVIYNNKWGLKAVSPPSVRAVAAAEDFAGQLIGRGAAALILGCTELPLALPGTLFRGVPLIDPVRALARALVREAAPGKLKALEP